MGALYPISGDLSRSMGEVGRAAAHSEGPFKTLALDMAIQRQRARFEGRCQTTCSNPGDVGCREARLL